MPYQPEVRICYRIWSKYFIPGHMTCCVFNDQVRISLDFNNENINPQVITCLLNQGVASSPVMLSHGWEPNFKLVVCRGRPEVMNYFKRVLFIMKKRTN